MARAMKDSGNRILGCIPATWEVKKLKYVAQLYTGNSIKDDEKERYEDPVDAVPYLSSKDIDVTFLTADYENGMYVKKDDKSFKFAPAGSTLMCIEGGSAGRKKTKLKHQVAFVNKLCCFNPTSVDNSFLFYWLCSPNFEDEFKQNITGLIGGVSISVLQNMETAIPPLDEQACIVHYLDTECARIDAVMEQTRASIEEYKKLKQSIITEAVTKGIRPNRPMKDSGIDWIGQIPADWKLAKIKIGVSKVGSGKTPSGGAESYSSEGVLFLRSQNIYDIGIVLDNPTFITPDIDEEMKNTRVQPNDVLLNITGGSIGRCCIFPESLNRANVNQHVSIIRVVNNIFLPEFMHYYWMSRLGEMSIKLYQTGGNREGMTADAIKNSPIPLCSIIEQREIVLYLDNMCTEMDALIAKKEQLLSEMESYKKSLIFEYVTGKKEVCTL